MEAFCFRALILLKQAFDFNWRKFRSRHFAMHQLDGAIAGLLAAELDIVGIHIRAEPIAPEAAVRIGLNHEEVLRAFDLHFHASVCDRAKTFDVLCLPEIGMTVLMEVFRLEVRLAGKRGRGRQQQGQSAQGSEGANALLWVSCHRRSHQRRKKLRRRYTNTAITASGIAQPIQTGGCQRRVSGRASRLIADADKIVVPIQPYQYIAGPDFAGLVRNSHSLMRGWYVTSAQLASTQIM